MYLPSQTIMIKLGLIMELTNITEHCVQSRGNKLGYVFTSLTLNLPS